MLLRTCNKQAEHNYKIFHFENIVGRLTDVHIVGKQANFDC